MQPKVKSEMKVNWILPTAVWAMTLATLVAGYWYGIALYALGLEFVAAAVLVTVASHGSAHAQIDPLSSSDRSPARASLLKKSEQKVG